MISLVYVSSATRLLTKIELETLLHKCRTNNQKACITGLLLYVDGNFMQAVEGPEDAISDLQKRLFNDLRHTGMTILIKSKIAERQFPNWAMSLREKLDLSPENRAAFSRFLVESKKADCVNAAQQSDALILVESFRTSMV